MPELNDLELPQQDEPRKTDPADIQDVFSARNLMLGIEAAPEVVMSNDDLTQAENEAETAINKIQEGLMEAEGVTGTLHFAPGDASRTITLLPVDNSEGGSDRLIVFALLASTAGNIAPNATAQLTIVDDEEYDPPVFEMAQEQVTLTQDEPTAELTVRRVSGLDYYTTVYAATYSITAVGGEDFRSIESLPLVFAPGVEELTVPVEALCFDRAGNFGVRLFSDGTCALGETDRTIVHIGGEGSPGESVVYAQSRTVQSQQAQEEAPAPSNAVEGASLMAVSADDPAEVLDITDRCEITGGRKRVYEDSDEDFNLNRRDPSIFIRLPLDIEVRKHIRVTCEVYHSYNSIRKKLEWKAGYQKRGRYDYGTRSWSTYTVWDNRYSDDITVPALDEENWENWTDGWKTYTMEIGADYFTEDVTEIELREVYDTSHVEIRNLRVEVVGPGGHGGVNFEHSVVSTEVPYINLAVKDGGGTVDGPGIDPVNISLTDAEGWPVTEISYPGDETIYLRWNSEAAAHAGLALMGLDSERSGVHSAGWYSKIGREGTWVEDGVVAFPVEKLSSNWYYPGGDFNLRLNVNYFPVTVHLEKADGGATYLQNTLEDPKKPTNDVSFKTTTGAVITGYGKPGSGRAITGYAVYASYTGHDGKPVVRELQMIYRNPQEPSRLGSDNPDYRFFLPCPQFANRDGTMDIYIRPVTEYQGLEIRPHPSEKDTSKYGKRAWLARSFSLIKEDADPGDVTELPGGVTEIKQDAVMADENGVIEIASVNSGASYNITAVPDAGYVTEWINGTYDYDEDGIIDNISAGLMDKTQALELYSPLYGNTLTYQVNQVSPKYYYRFVQIPRDQLMDGRTRTGYVYQDSRTILQFDPSDDTGTIPQRYKTPVANALVQIGSNQARADEKGKYVIPMDGLPDKGRASTVVKTNDGTTYYTYSVINVEHNIEIPFYDTFKPLKARGVYSKKENASNVSTTGAIMVKDDSLSISVEVENDADGLYIKAAEFYITNSAGAIVLGPFRTDKEYEKNAPYIAKYAENGLRSTATLTFNPGQDMLSGNRVYVRFIDQNDTEHKAMDIGYTFIKPMTLQDFVMGTIGVSDKTLDDVLFLGNPLMEMDLGQLNHMTTTAGVVEPTQQRYDANMVPQYQYPVMMYSYNWDYHYTTGWQNIAQKTFGGGTDPAGSGSSSGDKDNSGVDKDPGGDDKLRSSGDSEDPFGKSNGSVDKELAGMTKITDALKNGNPDSDKNSPAPPAGASIGNDNSKSTEVTTDYRFSIVPSIMFNLVTTSRKAGENPDGTAIYKTYFEELSFGVTLDIDAEFRVEIALPIGISLMVKPSLGGKVEGIYLMKTDYTGDPYWTERAIEYTRDEFKLFTDSPAGDVSRIGYIGLNPYLSLMLGVKVLIFEVDGGAEMSFDMDFAFGDMDSRTYGLMKGEAKIDVLLLNLSVYDHVWDLGSLHLFGENKAIDPKDLSSYASMGKMANAALQSMADDLSGTVEVKERDRSYLDQTSAWNGGASLMRMARNGSDNEPVDETIYTGVMPGGVMDSVSLGNGDMLAVYIDDDANRLPNDRSRVAYTIYRDGVWSEGAFLDSGSDDGTMDKDPVIYDMGDQLFIAWMSADRTFGGDEASLATAAANLNALNIQGVFYDKTSGKFSAIQKVTDDAAENRHCDDNIAITRLNNNGNDLRVYYTKTKYQETFQAEDSAAVQELISASSAIMYRDYEDGQWTAEYDAATQQALRDSGVDVARYTDVWYGQNFVDTRINGHFPLITSLEADHAADGAWDYFAFVGDRDGKLSTAGDRRVYLLFGGYPDPVCVTPVEGNYDDLQFVNNGHGDLLLMFKSDKIDGYVEQVADGNGNLTEQAAYSGGAAYVNLSEVFEKQNYTGVYNAGLGCFQVYHNDIDGNSTGEIYEPETAVAMDGVMQCYQLIADEGGRLYVLWTENTVNDDGTSGIQVYASVYNGNSDWIDDGSEGSPDYDVDNAVTDATWSQPELITSPITGSYRSFAAQIVDDSICLLAKRTSPEGNSELAFNRHYANGVLTYNDDTLSSRYVYAQQANVLHTVITNTGTKAIHSLAPGEGTNSTGTWKAVPGKYRIIIEVLGEDQQVVATLGDETHEFVWNIGTSVTIDSIWAPEDLREDSDVLDLQVRVIDADSGEQISSELMPIQRCSELSLGEIEVTETGKDQAQVAFKLSNSGNLAAEPVVVISAVDDDGKTYELARRELDALAPLDTVFCPMDIVVDERFQTIEDALGSYTLYIDVLDGEEIAYSAAASGEIHYDASAISIAEAVESISLDRTSLSLAAGATQTLKASILPAPTGDMDAVKWVSSDESVVTVASDGTVTAVGPGSASITAYAMPGLNCIRVLPSGASVVDDLFDAVPSSALKSQKIAVTISDSSSSDDDDDDDSGSSSSGSSAGSSSVPGVSSSGEGTVTTSRDGSVTITPDEGNRITGVIVNGKRVSIPTDGKLTGLKATDKVEVVFEPIRAVELADYTDLVADAWYTDAVHYAMSHGLFNGTSDSTFAPGMPMTRGMLATVLYRADGLPDGELPSFDDVPGGQYYTEAVGWAAERGIVTGYGDGTFGPDDPITREQLAVMLWRYAGKPTPPNLLLDFTDADQAGDYAQDALRWAVEQGIINGKGGGILDPQGQASRAEVATMLMRFLESEE